MKKTFIIIGIIACFFLAGCGRGAQEELYIYNAIDQINGEVITQFEREFDVKVHYNTYKDPEEIFDSLAENPTKYDIIFAQNQYTSRMIREGWLHDIPHEKLANFKNINQGFNPSTQYTIPYMSGTMGILYDEGRVQAPINSWKALWDARYRGDIIMSTFRHDSLAIALGSLKYAVNDKDAFHIDQARVALQQQMGLVQSYQSINMPENMAWGRAIIAAATSNQAEMAIEKGRIAGGFSSLRYVIPEEGGIRFISSMVIPKGVKNRALAERFIDFLLLPEISAKNAGATGLTSVVKGAAALLPIEMQSSEVMHPTQKQLEACRFLDYDIFAEMEMEKAWQAIKPNLWVR